MYDKHSGWSLDEAEQEPRRRPAPIAPGRQTLTMRLPPGDAPIQRREAAGGPAVDDAAQRRMFDDALRPDLSDSAQTAAAHGIGGGGSALPYRETLQPLFGRHDLSQVVAHDDDTAREGAAFLGAAAYATGDHVAFASTPDLHTAAHEAAHVVQQRGGVQLYGGVGERGDVYERHADEVADRVVRGESVEALLDVHAGAGGHAPSPGAAVQRLEYGELKTGKWYEVTGYAFPMYLRAKRVSSGATFTMDDKSGPTVEVPFDKVAREAPKPAEAPTADEAAQRAVLGAIWDAYGRIKRVTAALAPAVDDAVDPNTLPTKIKAARAREGKALLKAFRDNLLQIGAGLGAQLASSELLFTSTAQRATAGEIGETARTDTGTGKMTLYKAFFDSDRVSRGNTIAHEMVHAVLKVEDQAYKGSRLFEYLKPEYRLQNPDSYVQLLNELDPDGGVVKDAPGFEVATEDGGFDAAKLKRDLAIVQHVAQRSSYILTACAAELTGEFVPAFMSQSPHLKQFMAVIRANDAWQDKQANAKALHDWADEVAKRMLRVVPALCADVKVVGTASTSKEGKIVADPQGGDALHLTYFAGTDKPHYWLCGKVQQMLGYDSGFEFIWNLAAAVVDKIEPFGAKMAD